METVKYIQDPSVVVEFQEVQIKDDKRREYDKKIEKQSHWDSNYSGT